MNDHPPDYSRFSRRPHFGPAHWRGRRRFFLPFALFFGGIAVTFFIGLAAIISLVMNQGHMQMRGDAMLFACSIPLAFILMITMIAAFTFRRFGRPMTDIFAAIDSIAEGDLSTRVPEHYPRDFGQLARRFNHMVSELERAEQQRRNLTADIAHELRTPLHIIQGNLEGMLDGVYEPTTENINITLDETKLLAVLVNDLQTLSLAEAGQLPLHPTRFLLADLIEDVVSSFASQTASLGVSVQKDIADPAQAITADYDRLNQVLSNLFSNAIRHTPRDGAISFTTQATGSGARIAVKDTGSGIPAEDIPFIFDRFWRGDKSRSERTNSGLGLAIAKQLILAHHGTIEVKSEMDEGTTFVIELPA